MPERIVIPSSFAEYEANFRRPVLAMLALDRVTVVQRIFDSWEPWKLTLNNVEVKSDGNLAEQAITFKLSEKGIALILTAVGFRFTKENATWSAAEETQAILHAAKTAVMDATNMELTSQAFTIALHFQPTTKRNTLVLAPLFTDHLSQVFASEPTVYATSVRWKDRLVSIDGSAVYANGIFLRLSHTFDGFASLEQILERGFDQSATG